MRKLAKVLLAGVAALSLTACGQAEGTTKIFVEVKQRPLYIVDEKTGFDD